MDAVIGPRKEQVSIAIQGNTDGTLCIDDLAPERGFLNLPLRRPSNLLATTTLENILHAILGSERIFSENNGIDRVFYPAFTNIYNRLPGNRVHQHEYDDGRKEGSYSGRSLAPMYADISFPFEFADILSRNRPHTGWETPFSMDHRRCPPQSPN